MPYLKELLPEFRKGAKIRRKYWGDYDFVEISDFEKGLIFTNIWYVVTGTCWTIKRTLAERIECFGFLEALIEMVFLLYLGFM